MSIKFELNEFTGHWWFDLGIYCSSTEYHPDKNWVFAIALGFASIQIRW